MLALVWAARHFRPYLYGKKFVLLTDHHSLQWLHKFKEPKGQVARWLEVLSEFDYTVVHQRRYLTLRDGVLHRIWEDIPGGGVGRHLQLVLPASLVKNVLEGLHSTLMGGHMGAAKTLEKVRARFYWPGQRNDVDMWCRKCAI